MHVLERFFGITHAQAIDIMMTVHRKGLAVVGVFSFEIAETKVTQVMDYARRNQHPLAVHDGTGIGTRAPARWPAADRLALAVSRPARSTLPGDRRRPGDARRDARARRRGRSGAGCSSSRASAPTDDALDRAGLRVTPRARRRRRRWPWSRSAAAAPRTSATSPAPWRCCARARRWRSTARKTDGVDSLARAGRPSPAARRRLRQGPWPGRLARRAPRRCPPRSTAWAARRRARAQRRRLRDRAGHVLVRRPRSRAAAGSPRRFDGRLKGRVADLGAGWGWLALEALARCPAITAIDLYEADARALDAARANVADPRAALPLGRRRRPRRAGRRPTTPSIANPPFHQRPRGRTRRSAPPSSPPPPASSSPPVAC